MLSNTPTIELSASKRAWTECQHYEMLFWKEKWPYRTWSVPELQKLRHGDAVWFLSNLGFTRKDESAFNGFTGDVLEVGCGPLGFFELMKGVKVTAVDSLMRSYAAEIPYSLLGSRGCTTYVENAVGELAAKYRFVVCSNVLVQTPDWMEFLEQLVDRLRPDGELLLTTDTYSKPTFGNMQVFTPEQLKRALGWLGLKRFERYHIEELKGSHSDYRVFARAGF